MKSNTLMGKTGGTPGSGHVRGVLWGGPHTHRGVLYLDTRSFHTHRGTLFLDIGKSCIFVYLVVFARVFSFPLVVYCFLPGVLFCLSRV